VNNEEVHKYLTYLDGRSPSDEHEAIAKLDALGADIPGLMMKRYKISRRWSDRASCVKHCIKYAKTNKDAYQIGITALRDKSKLVRHKACMLLSVAQKKEAIEHLKDLLSDEASREDAVAAIDVLLNLNNN
jgi:hypothetical protein